LEIILAESSYIPTLEYARKTHHEIDTTGLTGFEEKKKREEILNFIDPAAFYGLFYKTGVKINGTNTKVKKEQLYTDILEKFHTQNTIYLDIRNEEGYSYNFFENYDDSNGNNVAYSINGSNFVTAAYNNNWPILAITPTGTTNNTETDIEIKLCTNDNPEPLIYHTDIVTTPDKKYGQFIGTDAIMSVGATWTKQLLFKAFNRQNGNTFQSVATYNRINFYRQTAYEGDNPRVPKKTEFHHNLFGSIHHSEINQLNHHSKEVHLGSQKLAKGDINGKEFTQIVEKNVTWDDQVVVFQGIKRETAKQAKSYLTPFVKTKPHSFRSSIFINNESKVFDKQHFKRVIVDEGNDAIKLFRLSNINKFDNNIETQTTLGITQTELSALKTYTGLDTDSNVYINLERIMPTGSGTTFINSFNVEYSKFNLKLVGFDTSGNAVPATTIGNPIVVYSNDGINFFSKAFTELRGIDLPTFNPANGWIEMNFIFTNNSKLEFTSLRQAFEDNLRKNYDGLIFNGMTVSLSSSCSYVESGDLLPTNGFRNINIIVKQGEGTPFANSAESSITLYENNLSGTDCDNAVAHEFGHLFGLKDRYLDGGTFRGAITDTITSYGGFKRVTIPLKMPKLTTIDPDYNHIANLYSVSKVGGITPFQLSVLFGRKEGPEYDYNSGIALFSYSVASTTAFYKAFAPDIVIIYGICTVGGILEFDGIEINDEEKTNFQFLKTDTIAGVATLRHLTEDDIQLFPLNSDFHKFLKEGAIGIMPYIERHYGDTKLLIAKTFSSQNRQIGNEHELIQLYYTHRHRKGSKWKDDKELKNRPKMNPDRELPILKIKADEEIK
jgi:hypothetical protein